METVKKRKAVSDIENRNAKKTGKQKQKRTFQTRKVDASVHEELSHIYKQNVDQQRNIRHSIIGKEHIDTHTHQKEHVITYVETRDGLVILHRKDTSDIKAIKEACANLCDLDDPSLPRKVSSSYERIRASPVFRIETGEKWLDCGTQIGSFTLRALQNGAARVVSVEPEDTSAALLAMNVRRNGFTDKHVLERYAIVAKEDMTVVTLHKTDSTYRHSLIPTIKHVDKMSVAATTLNKLLKKYPDTTCVKFDIEGNEKPVLLSVDWKNTNVKKIVYEYSCDHHPEMDIFHDIADYMRKHFSTVYFIKSVPKRGCTWDTKITRGANGRLVWCTRSDAA